MTDYLRRVEAAEAQGSEVDAAGDADTADSSFFWRWGQQHMYAPVDIRMDTRRSQHLSLLERNTNPM